MMQTATTQFDVPGAFSLQDEIDAWKSESRRAMGGPISPETDQRLQWLALRTQTLISGLKVAWQTLTQNEGSREISYYAPRLKAIELLASIVEDILSRMQGLIEETQSDHPEWKTPSEVERVRSHLADVQTIREKSQHQKEWLDRDRPPFSSESVRKSREAYARGEGELLGDMLARLNAGAPLVPE